MQKQKELAEDKTNLSKTTCQIWNLLMCINATSICYITQHAANTSRLLSDKCIWIKTQIISAPKKLVSTQTNWSFPNWLRGFFRILCALDIFDFICLNILFATLKFSYMVCIVFWGDNWTEIRIVRSAKWMKCITSTSEKGNYQWRGLKNI